MTGKQPSWWFDLPETFCANADAPSNARPAPLAACIITLALFLNYFCDGWHEVCVCVKRAQYIYNNHLKL